MSGAYRAGQSIEDYCRACKTDRQHTIIAVDPDGRPIRVICGFCRSQHNYRGGGRVETSSAASASASSAARGQDPPSRAAEASPTFARPPDATRRPASPTPSKNSASPRAYDGGNLRRGRAGASAGSVDGNSFPIVSDRERSAPPVMVPNESGVDLEMLLRRIIREEAGVSPVAPAEKWRGGTLVLRPGKPGIQEKSWPIETFFHKIVMVRNRLRTAEQQLNASDLPDDVKVKLQGYISGCYGSLTSFNVLFADDDDAFKGAGGD
jgi:hypothetical protein